eukprot:6192468-Prymnesium_polylepis.1
MGRPPFGCAACARQVVNKLLGDKGVSDAVAARRAQALLVMGRIFKATKAQNGANEDVVTVQAGRRHGISFVRGARGECVVESYAGVDARIQPGHLLSAIDGESAVGYNHACGACEFLLQPMTPLRRQLSFTLRSNTAAASTTWRDHIKMQLQMMGGGAARDSGSPQAERPAGSPGDERRESSWAESAGRPGEPGYRLGDLTRIAARRTGRALRPLANRLYSGLADGANGGGRLTYEGEAVDLAGWLGKRSDYVGQWRSRYFKLEGGRLSWSRQEDDTAHGTLELAGARPPKAARAHPCGHVRTRAHHTTPHTRRSRARARSSAHSHAHAHAPAHGPPGRPQARPSGRTTLSARCPSRSSSTPATAARAAGATRPST